MHILIIEDNQEIASTLFYYLEAKGHIVDAAGSGISGRHLALVGQYDAIVLDVMLPGMDGITLCSMLREKGCKTTPILMISARDSLDDKIAGLDAGADDYLVKPVPLSEIELRLRVLFRLRSSAKVHTS
jgi:DNA-binding response OmpR family regulator